MSLDRARLQQLFDGAQQSWLLHDDDDWRAFTLRRSVARPPWWQPFERRAWEGARAAAIARGKREDASALTMMPFWIGSNEDEVERDDDWRCTCLLVDHVGAAVLELPLKDAPELACVARVRVRRVLVPHIALTRAYSPELRSRDFGRFTVMDALCRVIVDAFDDVVPVTLSESPRATVPAFSTQMCAAFPLEGHDTRVRALVANAVERGSFTPDDE